MNARDILEEAAGLQSQLVAIRRDLHQHPELGFDLKYTKELVKQELIKMGYAPQECGKAGLTVLAGGSKPGETILIRGDMDALPIQEEAEVEYRSRYEGKMHGCGHDMHTAMMLGAAKLLKEHEEEIKGTVKLMFQPAEEIFLGSSDMIKAGVLDNPKVDAALMIHVLAGKTSNVIPDMADMWGTIRTIDQEGKVGNRIKQRMTEMAESVAKAYRCEAQVEFYDYCPCMVVDTTLVESVLKYMKELLGQGAASMADLGMNKIAGGSEDFAFVSQEVPTVSLFLSAGNSQEGYRYSQHNPKVRFDDSVLSKGSAAYVYGAMRYLEEI